MPHVTLDIDDVRRAGSVRDALIAWCDRSDDTMCGQIGPAFTTSGPGSGRSAQCDESDFAGEAVAQGALYYLDEGDGRLIEAEELTADDQDEDGDWPEDAIHSPDGVWQLGYWSDASVVRLECPSLGDALENPAIAAAMAQSVIDYHAEESDCAEWRRLIEAIRSAAVEFEDVDLDRMPDE